ncbi:MAG: hypothetical protein ACJA1D_000179 [Polaribacter sp.]|jgi:hypothetical protein
MTKKEVNSKVLKLFNFWKKKLNTQINGTEKYYSDLEEFRKECKNLHDVVGAYEVMTYQNALKMASICSSIPFVSPFRMLMKLQKTTENNS